MKHKINYLRSSISALALSLVFIGSTAFTGLMPEEPNFFPDQPVIVEKLPDSPDSEEGLQPLSDWDEDFKRIEE